jgi:hypothetical protein
MEHKAKVPSESNEVIEALKEANASEPIPKDKLHIITSGIAEEVVARSGITNDPRLAQDLAGGMAKNIERAVKSPQAPAEE